MTTIYLPAFTRVFLPGIKTGEDAENSLNTELGFVSIKEHYRGYRVLQQFLESARF
jgi:hypothetical protein